MRFPVLTPEQMSPRQREVAEAITKRRTGGFSGPYLAMNYSPEVADKVQALTEFMRFNLQIPERLRVLAVLITAAWHKGADTEYFLHDPGIRQAGLSDDKIQAITLGKRPANMTADEEMVYDFCTQLQTTGRIKNATFDQVAGRFGRGICMELLTICGSTAMLTMMMKVTDTRFGEGEPAH